MSLVPDETTAASAETQIAEIARRELTLAKRRRGELLTELRQLNIRIVNLETMQDAVGVQVLLMPAADPDPGPEKR